MVIEYIELKRRCNNYILNQTFKVYNVLIAVHDVFKK